MNDAKVPSSLGMVHSTYHEQHETHEQTSQRQGTETSAMGLRTEHREHPHLDLAERDEEALLELGVEAEQPGGLAEVAAGGGERVHGRQGSRAGAGGGGKEQHTGRGQAHATRARSGRAKNGKRKGDGFSLRESRRRATASAMDRGKQRRVVLIGIQPGGAGAGRGDKITALGRTSRTGGDEVAGWLLDPELFAAGRNLEGGQSSSL